eukprot:scaffold12199_cov63-Phaeocystis_antarctica.AAC.2
MAAVLVNLDSLPDDSFSQVISAAGDIAGDYVPFFKAVRGLGCVSKGMLQQLHRVRPTVSVHSLVVVQRHCHGPWRVVLMHRGELTHAVVEQAKKYNCGRVRSIVCHALGRVPRATLAPAVAMRVVPELLGAGGSLIMLNLSGVVLNGTWASTFGEAACCSAALRTLCLDDCKLHGPLPELRLPALRELSMEGDNYLTGGLEPLQGCLALQELSLHANQLTGSLKPLQGCMALQELRLHDNQLTGGLEGLQGCTALRTLMLDGNQLTGGLEPLRRCTALVELWLFGNQFTGELEPLRSCKALQVIRLENNQLAGGLEHIRGCTALRDLWLFDNQLTGGLEPLRGCTALQELSLASNQLTGDLKPLSGLLPTLRLFNLEGNQLVTTGEELLHRGV